VLLLFSVSTSFPELDLVVTPFLSEPSRSPELEVVLLPELLVLESRLISVLPLLFLEDEF
jgi:hypothetical protein